MNAQSEKSSSLFASTSCYGRFVMSQGRLARTLLFSSLWTVIDAHFDIAASVFCGLVFSKVLFHCLWLTQDLELTFFKSLYCKS